MHAIINHMIVTFALFLLAFAAPQATTFTGEWLLTWDQTGPQYIRVSVTQESAAVRVTWENESIQCTQTDNVCVGTVTENGNPEAGKAKITMNGDEVIEEGIILIENNKIINIGKAAEISVPANAQVIDVTGRVSRNSAPPEGL